MKDAGLPDAEIRIFRIDIQRGDLDDLHDRLGGTWRPGEIPGAGWDRGVPLDHAISTPDVLVGDICGLR